MSNVLDESPQLNGELNFRGTEQLSLLRGQWSGERVGDPLALLSTDIHDRPHVLAERVGGGKVVVEALGELSAKLFGDD
jgi:hypothetical protein